jgi:hypothetical protein
MTISQLVERYGLNIKVSCQKSGFPDFKVLRERVADDFGYRTYICQYDNGEEFVLHDCLQDYVCLVKGDLYV